MSPGRAERASPSSQSLSPVQFAPHQLPRARGIKVGLLGQLGGDHLLRLVNLLERSLHDQIVTIPSV